MLWIRLIAYWLSLHFWASASSSRIRKMQIRKFGKIYSFARKESVYYHSAYSKLDSNIKLDSWEKISSIPIVEKQDLRSAGLENVIPTRFNKEKLVYCTTSGSTGQPFQLAYTKYANLTAYLRVFYIMRRVAHYTPMKRMTLLSKYEEGKEFNVEKNLNVVKHVQRKINFFSRQLVNVFDDPHTIYEKISSYNPYILYSSSSAVDVLANYISDNGYSMHIPYIILIAEPVSKIQYEKYRHIFGATIINVYGAQEVPTIGYEVNMEGIFHLFPNSCLVEFADISNTEYGKKGKLIVTNLINKAQPFVRYNLNDFTDIIEDVDFGSKFIGQVVGRVSDVLTLPDGGSVFHYCISELFIDFKCALQYKFIQINDGLIKVLILPDSHYSDEEVISEAKKRWATKYNDYPLTVEIVNHFDIDEKTGKFKVIERIRTS